MMAADIDNTKDQQPRLGLLWLTRLRWVALAGQLLVCALAWRVLHIALPLAVLTAGVGWMLASNLALEWCRRRRVRLPEARVCAALIFLDTLIMTAMFYWAGGARNPFTALYLMHITLAAILLPPWQAWLALAWCGLCYGLLFLSPHALQSSAGGTCCVSFDFHLQGMWLGLLLTGGFIALFVSRLSADSARRERELAQARQLSERSKHFASLATLAAGVAHELATPLGTIAVVSSDFERQICRVCQDGDYRADARLIRAEVERCREILEKLRDRTTQGVGEPFVPVPLAELPALLAPYLQAAHLARVDCRVEAGLGALLAPRTALLQSLAVLVKNACEADPGGGPVRLRVTAAAGGRLRFTVSDRGVGMDAETVERACEPFFTTKPAGQGMGLGLFLVRTLVARVHGDLSIDSAPGRGTTVNLEMPLT
ncbi:MAG: ATP-binding protein [Verrucomicrobiales bacterium]|nr:ATP-binding protein [Verrucomicrobiales bacterium]